MSEQKTPKELRRKAFELILALYRVTDLLPRGEVLRERLKEKGSEIFSHIVEYGFTDDLPKEAACSLAKIQSMKGFLRLGRSLGLANPLNFIILEREYNLLNDFFRQELDALKQSEEKQKGQFNSGTNLHGNKKTGEGSTSEKSKNRAPFQVKGVPKLTDGASEEDNRVKNRRAILPERVIRQNSTSAPSEIRGANERQEAMIQHLKEKPSARVSDFFTFFSNISSKTIQRDLQDLVQKNILKKEGERRWTTYALNNVL